MYDMIMNYDYAVSIVDSKGWEAFFQLLQNKYKSYNLYQVSKYWYESDEYICKAKGGKGDVIIGWEHKCKGEVSKLDDEGFVVVEHIKSKSEEAIPSYDYTNQAWIIDGKYVHCGHPDSMNCNCYGRIHEGEEANGKYEN